MSYRWFCRYMQNEVKVTTSPDMIKNGRGIRIDGFLSNPSIVLVVVIVISK